MTTTDFYNAFGEGVERIPMFPASYGLEQRVAASKIATDKGKGLVMELHSSTTHFYADPSIPVGKVAIWSPPSYKAMPEYVTTLDSADEPWETETDRRTWAKLSALTQAESISDMKYRLDAVRELANAYGQADSPQVGRDFLALLDTPIETLKADAE